MPPADTEKNCATPQSSSLKESGTAAPRPAVVQDAPIANLPVELVSEIIKLGVDDAFYSLPVIASHVCSHWRTLMLESPLLWTTVSIHNIITDDLTHQLEHAYMFAVRSGLHFMTVHVDLSSPHVSTAQCLVSSIAEYILQHAERIRHLAVRYTPEFQGAEVSAIVPPVLARRLEACSIQNVPSNFFRDHPVFEGYPQNIISAFKPPEGEDNRAGEMFPNLEKLGLSATPLCWSRFSPRRLRCLTLQDMTWDTAPGWKDLWGVLQANAHTLTDLDLSWVQPVDPPVQELLELPVVQKLRMVYADPSFLLDFFTMFQVPNLLALDLHDEGEDGANAHNLIQSDIFACIMEHIPLQRLHYLHLSGISFLPNSSETVQLGVDPIPAALFRQLCALERLKLTRPDRYTLEALNTPQPTQPDTGANAPPLLQVIPQLAHLSLHKIYPIALEEFLMGRAELAAEGHVVVRKLDVLDVRFHSRSLEDPESRFSGVARNIVHRLQFLDPPA